MFVNGRNMFQSVQNYLFISYSCHSQYFNSQNLTGNYLESCAENNFNEIAVHVA
jgi:hypothetical protein